MKYASRLLGVASTLVLVALGANPAYAAGTLAGTSITNTAQINYSVSGVAQTAGTASNTVLVDRKATLFLIGTVMDYEVTDLTSGFTFSNPNEKGRCGCGESFHV